jgi:hypothetical protein
MEFASGIHSILREPGRIRDGADARRAKAWHWATDYLTARSVIQSVHRSSRLATPTRSRKVP